MLEAVQAAEAEVVAVMAVEVGAAIFQVAVCGHLKISIVGQIQ